MAHGHAARRLHISMTKQLFFATWAPAHIQPSGCIRS